MTMEVHGCNNFQYISIELHFTWYHKWALSQMHDVIMQLRYSISTLCVIGWVYWKPRVPCRLFMLINKQGENLGKNSWTVVLLAVFGCLSGSYATALQLNFYGRVTIVANNDSKCLDIFRRNLFKLCNGWSSISLFYVTLLATKLQSILLTLFLWALSTRSLLIFSNCAEAKALTTETQLLNDISFCNSFISGCF